jgi:hypothetical protein
MKIFIISILFLCGLKMSAQRDGVNAIDSIATAIQESSLADQRLFSLDSGMLQLTPKGKYAKFEASYLHF